LEPGFVAIFSAIFPRDEGAVAMGRRCAVACNSGEMAGFRANNAATKARTFF
jgi:hypothetical protein